ncbi:STT3 domain-containing protein [Candidatus Lokiarchaeum ossiferum]|uniref:STT3 domain-containing protein n=1 Tax=Candidatus Lokiarchaeum ossiferum TaxID=2951803 RepID=UPI00352F3C31
MGKIKQYFSEKGDKIKTSVKIDKDAPFFYISLVLIVILAILVRASPVVQGTFLIKAFDPWYQYDSLTKLIDMGLYDWLHFHDFKFWFPEGVDRFNLRPGLLVTNALIYWFLNGIGIHVNPFQVAYYFPAFMGGLTVLVMYFLGKEILDRRTGLIAAFFLAFSPGHMQRTVIGFFDNETIGVFAVLLTFLFFIRAVKSGKLSDGIFAGLSIGYLALSWGGLTYAFSLLPLIVFIIIILDKYNPNILLAYTSSIMIGLLVYSINPGFKWGTNFNDMDFFVPFFFEIALVVYHFIYMQKETGNYEKILTGIKWASIPVILTALIIFWVNPGILPFDLGSRLQSIINPNIRSTINLVASVGEHAPSPWSVFYYNAFIPLLFIIPGIYFAIRRGNIEDILMIVFVLTLFYFTGSMIRIILLFAPAAALLGAYGLANIMKQFGTLMKKDQMITRRRKRQIQRTIAKSEGIVVYIGIGLLFFAQSIHAIDISAEQMGYADIVTAGALHDWEETLTWMKYNLDSSSVAVSWWDYGYWLSAIGNITTVNDNGTWNQTRIGMTGMAMMETDERVSAQIFQRLQADYVVVFFGHLYSGIGGDEGKWPWMLRICNDNTARYDALGMRQDSWYSDDEVFNEADYVNETTGLYGDKWFDSTLVRLMFAGAITTSAGLPQQANQLQENLVNQIEGTDTIQARTDADGDLWSTHDSINGAFEPQYFTPAFFSTSEIVKVFKVDYTGLGAEFEVKDTHLDTDGTGYFEVENTGNEPIKIDSLQLNYEGSSYDLNYTVENDLSDIQAGESRYVWFDTEEINEDWTELKSYSLKATANFIGDQGRGYFITADSSTSLVEVPSEELISIDRSASSIELDGADQNFNINIKNDGIRPVLMENITILGEDTATTPTLIAPSNNYTFSITRNDIVIDDKFNEDVQVQMNSKLGKVVSTTLGVNTKGYKLSIKGDLTTKIQDSYLYDYASYSQKEGPIGDLYMNYNTDSYLLDDGTLQLTVENTGEKTFSIQSIYADDVHYDIELDDFLNGGDPFLEAGESVTLQTTITDVVLDTPVKIVITGMNDQTVSSDGAYMIPRSASKSIAIMDEADSMSAAFTDESVRLVVKNTGSLAITLDNIIVNDTLATKVDLTNGMVIGGTTSTLTIQPNGIAVLDVDYSGLKVNISNTVEIVLNTTEGIEASADFTSRLPQLTSPVKIELKDNTETYTEANYLPNKLDVKIILSMVTDESVNLDGFYYKINDAEDYVFISMSNITVKNADGDIVSDRIISGSSVEGETYYYSIDINLDLTTTVGSDFHIKIVTAEGYELFDTLTIA